MSELTGSHRSVLELEQGVKPGADLKPQQVIDYLLDNPHFFQQHPSLLENLQIPHQRKGSVSLVERQSEQLRHKVEVLNNKLKELICVAQQNEKIYQIYAALNLQLLGCEDMQGVQRVLNEVLLGQLKLAAVTLKLFRGPEALPEIQRHLLVDKRFHQGQYFFGRISQHEKQLLFAQQDVESVALILLGVKGELGILAIASDDASHFTPNMDTLLLDQLQQLLHILLPKLMSL